MAADCWVSTRMATKRCHWAGLAEGRARLSCRREAEMGMVSMMAEGEMWDWSMAAEGETTGMDSMGSARAAREVGVWAAWMSVERRSGGRS